MASELQGLEQVAPAITAARVIAVLGAHPEEQRPAFYVPDYLHAQGYRILPVNPQFVGHRLWGEPFAATLAELTGPVDIVDVFRRSEWVPDHVADILAMQPRPRLVWLQEGVRSPAAAARLLAAGIDVVQDRCLLADHRVLERRRQRG
ncbi:MAG TPA: CoA-binding protein [Kofleriaceae bacterium]|nr:CoA-binding protein [Kofleriaceae bacterium]